MILLLSALGCNVGPPTTSGPDGLVGRVVAHDGTPVPDVDVNTLETRVRTDADGRFAIPWKPPNQLVHFRVRGTYYERRYQPADADTEVTLTLPELRTTVVTCPPEPCFLELRWDVEPGLAAVLREACQPDREIPLQAAPVAGPVATCRQGAGSGARDLPIEVLDRGAAIDVHPLGALVRVEVRSLDEAPVPDDCVVRVGDRVAMAVGPGRFTAAMRDPGTIAGGCGGRPVVPVWLEPGSLDGPVVLEWSATGPVLDLEGVAPWLAAVRLVSESDRWSLELAPDAAGELHLPALGPGRYRLIVEGQQADPAALATAPPQPGRPGTVVLASAGQEALVGVLVVEEDRLDGRLRVSGP